MNALDRAGEIAAFGIGKNRWPAGTQNALIELLTTESDSRIRVAALSSLIRRGTSKARNAAWQFAINVDDAKLRRRAVELSVVIKTDCDEAVAVLIPCLSDPDYLVAEAAAFALGEFEATSAVSALSATATRHSDPMVREAAVAALGAIGDIAGLEAILSACSDKPAVRRRAVLALAPFDTPEVEAAINSALNDRDWQVRQAAEDLRSV